MKKMPDIFAEKERTFSFEFFPPKTEKGYQNLLRHVAELAELKPDFISCTYGAGGGNREKTFDIVQLIQKKHHIPGVAHLTCVLNSKAEILDILKDIKSRGICNVLALRGDPPLDNPDWKPGPDNFEYSYELCRFIREHFGDYFGIGVAGFPEGHPLCRDREKDAGFLKLKLDSGGDFVITQLFWDNQDYFDYVKRLRNLGITARVIPGLLPITGYEKMAGFCTKDGIKITPEVREIFEPIKDDKDATLKAGIEFTVRKGRELLDGGAPGLHFYTLNKSHPVREIVRQLKAV